MKLYVGITDLEWFQFLRSKGAREMNFWRPRMNTNFGVIAPGDLFLFKLKAPINKIAGGGFFVRHTVLPLSLAWGVFHEANGCGTIEQFQRKISKIRGDDERDPKIGCTTLTDAFYLDDLERWSPPSDWANEIVTGKSYDATKGEGARLYQQAIEAIQSQSDAGMPKASESPARFGSEIRITPRLGQCAFRIVVMEGYGRRCAITGERTLPVLEAAHIRPYAENGPHDLSNGLLLRSDFHTLFDRNYITVTTDMRIEVSKRIKEEFSNGREYYAYHGQHLKALPESVAERPAREFLEWHNQKFLSS